MKSDRGRCYRRMFSTLDYFSELEDAEINNEANEELLRMILEENHP